MGQATYNVVGGIVGAVVGFYAGDAYTGFQIGWALGGAYGASQAELPDIEGPRLTNFDTPSSTYDRVIPVVYGDSRIMGNAIWSVPIREVRTEEEVGGKGGPSQTSVSYSYYGSWATAVCEGEQVVKKIWFDTKLVYDATTNSIFISDHLARIKVYTGTETQNPDPLMESYLGVGNVPAYRGLVYIVFNDIPLGDYGNRIPQVSVLVGDPVDSCATLRLPELGAGVGSNHGMIVKTRSNYIGNSLLFMTNSFWITNLANQDTWELPSGGDALTSEGYWDNDGEYVYCCEDAFLTGYASKINISTGEFEYLDVNIGPDCGANTVSDRFVFWANGYGNAVTGIVITTKSLGGKRELTVGTHFKAGLTCDDDNTAWVATRVNATTIRINRVMATGLDGSGIAEFSSNSWDFTDPTWSIGGELVTKWVRQYNCLIVTTNTGNTATTPVVMKFAIEDYSTVTKTGELMYNASYPVDVSGEPCADMLRNQDGSRYMWLQRSDGAGAIQIDVLGMTYTGKNQSVDNICGMPAQINNEIIPHVATSSFIVGKYLDNYFWLKYDRYGPSAVDVKEVVEQMCARSGLVLDTDFTTTGIQVGDVINGYALDRQGTIAAYLGNLSNVFMFTAAESDWKLKFSSLTSTVEKIIPATDVGATSKKNDFFLKETITQELEVPQAIAVAYFDPSLDYQKGVQLAKRMNDSVNARSINTIDISIAMSASLAAKVAEKLLMQVWTQRQVYEFALSYKHVSLDAGSVVQIVDYNGTVHTMRIAGADFGVDYVLKISAIGNGITSYLSDAAAGEFNGYQQDVVSIVAAIYSQFLDIVALRDSETAQPNIYLTADSYHGSSWRGAVLYEELTDGNYSAPELIMSTGVMGMATTALASGVTTVWDDTNTVTVSLSTDTDALYSRTDIDVLNGANAALIGSEIVQFCNAVDNGNGTYTLSRLLRGRRGTEWAVGMHIAQEKFVMLSSGGVYPHSIDVSKIGTSIDFKVVPVGGVTLEYADKTVAFSAENMKPYSPVHVAAAKDGSNNLVVTWQRRGRVSAGWNNLSDIPLGETLESYEVDILTTGGVFKRTLGPVTSKTATYLRGDQITDFGAGTTQIWIKVYQKSSVVGRGRASTTYVATIG
jgi:hypothetical protein